MLTVRIAGWALAVERQLRLWSLEADLRQRVAEDGVGLGEEGARPRVRVVERAAHPDLL